MKANIKSGTVKFEGRTHTISEQTVNIDKDGIQEISPMGILLAYVDNETDPNT